MTRVSGRDPQPWLATAYVRGPSLDEAVAADGPMAAGPVQALIAGLAEGLAGIHAAGVIHRDLKPSNVLLAEDGPRIIDFGVSHAAETSSLTRTGLVVGLPGYMSPEQAEGREAASLPYRVVHGEPDLDRVPPKLSSLAARCLAKDPSAHRTGCRRAARARPGYPRGRPPADGPAGREHDHPDRAATVRCGGATDRSGASPGQTKAGLPARNSPRGRPALIFTGAAVMAVAVLAVAAAVFLPAGASSHLRYVRLAALADPDSNYVDWVAFSPGGGVLAVADGNGRTYLFAKWRFWRHNGAMPSVQIKDVPEQTHAVLRRRAAAAHQSLQEYLRARLIEEASEPTLDEVLDRAGGRSGGSVPLKDAVQTLRADRDRR
jgi:Protein kinase domain